MRTVPTTPSFRLDGQKALITGAGRGIGFACAAALAEAAPAMAARQTAPPAISQRQVEEVLTLPAEEQEPRLLDVLVPHVRHRLGARLPQGLRQLRRGHHPALVLQ